MHYPLSSTRPIRGNAWSRGQTQSRVPSVHVLVIDKKKIQNKAKDKEKTENKRNKIIPYMWTNAGLSTCSECMKYIFVAAVPPEIEKRQGMLLAGMPLLQAKK